MSVRKLSIWVKRVAFTAGAQAGIQALGLLGGLLILRYLEPRQFAFYTIAMSVVGMIAILSDAGVGTGLMALGGKCWEKPRELGIIYRQALRMRLVLVTAATLVSVPLLAALLNKQGAGWGTTALLVLLVLALAVSTLVGQLQENVLKLHQRVAPLQVTQFLVAALRVVALIGVLAWAPFAAAAVLVACGTQWVANRVLMLRIGAGLDRTVREVPPHVNTQYKAYVKRTLPGAVYYAFSGQLTVFLISAFGSGTAVAQVGAAGRLAMVCNLLSAIAGVLIIPRFARLPDKSQIILPVYMLTPLVVALVGSVFVGLVWFVPAVSDLVLGANYQGLQTEVVLSFCAALGAVITGLFYNMGAVRGVVIRPAISIPAALAFQVLSIAGGDLDSASGVLTIAALNAGFQGAIHMGYFICDWHKR